MTAISTDEALAALTPKDQHYIDWRFDRMKARAVEGGNGERLIEHVPIHRADVFHAGDPKSRWALVDADRLAEARDHLLALRARCEALEALLRDVRQYGTHAYCSDGTSMRERIDAAIAARTTTEEGK